MVADIAGFHGKSPTHVSSSSSHLSMLRWGLQHVMLRWGLQHGRSVILKSTKLERIAEHLDAFDLESPTMT